jgi:hypothetical protein
VRVARERLVGLERLVAVTAEVVLVCVVVVGAGLVRRRAAVAL